MELIKKRINIKRVALLSITALLAIFAFITKWPTVGVILSVATAALFFLKLSISYYSVTGSPIKTYQLFFEGERRGAVTRAISSKFEDETPDINFGSEGSGRVDLYLSKDKKFAQVTLYHYVPHTYQVIGEPTVFQDDEVAPLLNFLKFK